jgi:hypothetical protein
MSISIGPCKAKRESDAYLIDTIQVGDDVQSNFWIVILQLIEKQREKMFQSATERSLLIDFIAQSSYLSLPRIGARPMMTDANADLTC